MELINIFPLGNSSMEYSQNMHMFLTHLVEKYPMYAKMASEVPGYKILDNSLIELGGAVDITRVLSAAARIGADEIILPDIFQDGPATVKTVTETLQYLNELYPNRSWPYKLMAVAQGKNIEEWYECYMSLLKMPDVDVIGIPKVCAKMHPQGRPYFVNALCNIHLKPHHLLGLWYSFIEFNGYANLDAIRSCDTVLLSFMIRNELPIMGTRPDGFTLNLEEDIVDFTKINLQNLFTKYERGGDKCLISKV